MLIFFFECLIVKSCLSLVKPPTVLKFPFVFSTNNNKKRIHFNQCGREEFCFQPSGGRASAMSDTSPAFTRPHSPMFLNVTAPTEILLCEETLEMILTVTILLPLVACYIFPHSLKHTVKCTSEPLPVLMSRSEWPLSFGFLEKRVLTVVTFKSFFCRRRRFHPRLCITSCMNGIVWQCAQLHFWNKWVKLKIFKFALRCH